MNRTLLGLLASVSLVAPVVTDAAIISGTWNWSATASGVTYGGSFTIAGLDASVASSGILAATAVTTSFDTTGSGGPAYFYRPDFGGGLLAIGGAAGGGAELLQFDPPANDWSVSLRGVLTVPTFSSFAYFPVTGGSVFTREGTATRVTSVPEPAPLALLALGLAGVGLGAGRRRRTAPAA